MWDGRSTSGTEECGDKDTDAFGMRLTHQLRSEAVEHVVG